ncbi:bryoporin-like [Archocentrus centrarchus]|uniref:bryoporin-like n=1 Tax=Archocentrus centrarchus TaxID=63155 RepID=UPI0011E9BC98|nr:bryoporin-like [Archocentrus centrarchus]XP_030592701.1 bryoporin-like [Archocentrus centrarchus]
MGASDSRQCVICIKNSSRNYTLRNPRLYLESGQSDTALPSALRPSEYGSALFSKTAGAARGSVGVLTYDLYNESTRRADKKLAAMFSVPFDYNLYYIWHGVGVFANDVQCNSCLYNVMKDQQQRGFVRGRAEGPPLCYRDNDVTVTSSMTNCSQATLTVEVFSRQ